MANNTTLVAHQYATGFEHDKSAFIFGVLAGIVQQILEYDGYELFVASKGWGRQGHCQKFPGESKGRGPTSACKHAVRNIKNIKHSLFL